MHPARTRRPAAALATLAMLLLVLLPAAGRLASSAAKGGPHAAHTVVHAIGDGEPAPVQVPADDCNYCAIQANTDIPQRVALRIEPAGVVELRSSPLAGRHVGVASRGLGARGPPVPLRA